MQHQHSRNRYSPPVTRYDLIGVAEAARAAAMVARKDSMKRLARAVIVIVIDVGIFNKWCETEIVDDGYSM